MILNAMFKILLLKKLVEAKKKDEGAPLKKDKGVLISKVVWQPKKIFVGETSSTKAQKKFCDDPQHVTIPVIQDFMHDNVLFNNYGRHQHVLEANDPMDFESYIMAHNLKDHHRVVISSLAARNKSLENDELVQGDEAGPIVDDGVCLTSTALIRDQRRNIVDKGKIVVFDEISIVQESIEPIGKPVVESTFHAQQGEQVLISSGMVALEVP